MNESNHLLFDEVNERETIITVSLYVRTFKHKLYFMIEGLNGKALIFMNSRDLLINWWNEIKMEWFLEQFFKLIECNEWNLRISERNGKEKSIIENKILRFYLKLIEFF